MKPFKKYLLVMPIILCSTGPKSDNTSDTGMQNKVNRRGSQALIDYVGRITGSYNLDMGVQVYIDTTIGIRYEFTVEDVSENVLSHIAIFYKFSNPTQSVEYDFVRHKSSLIKYGGSSDSNPDVYVIGQETLDSFDCTHLQHGGDTKEISDFWMSPKVPGFSKLVNSLRNISPALPSMFLSSTIFNWGGLVKWTIRDLSESGTTVNLEMHLFTADTNVILKPKVFDVPTN